MLAPAVMLSGLALVGAPASAGSAATTTTVKAPTAAKKRIAGKRIHLKIRGNTLGRKARIRVKGVRGRAKGYNRIVRVKRNKIKRLRNLRPGKYRITPLRIARGTSKSYGKVRPRIVKVTRSRGAFVGVKYRKKRAVVSGPSNLRIDSIQVNGKSHIRARWNAATGKTVRTYRAHYSLSSGTGPWSVQDPPEPFTATSISYDVCSEYAWASGYSGWGYITAVFTDGSESPASNIIYYKLNCR